MTKIQKHNFNHNHSTTCGCEIENFDSDCLKEVNCMSEFVNYCKMCQKKISEHDDEDLNRCVKIAEISFWKKE